MTLADRRDISNPRRSPARLVRRRAWSRCWLPGAVATLLATIGGTAPAFAQGCDATCITLEQIQDQKNLLLPFKNLPNTPAGKIVLQENLLTEEHIYLNATQAEKIASGTILVAADIPANLLIRAFPGNPNYYYDASGQPTMKSVLPPVVTNAVTDINTDAQLDAMKPIFGTPDVYGKAYGYLPGQSDTLGNPPPYQVSLAIYDDPFTAANSSPLAASNQQTQGTQIGWQLQGDSNIGNFPSGHTLGSSIDALTFAILAPGNYQQLMLGEASFASSLNVYGVHYPLDVIGGRIMATYVVAQMLAGDNPIYPATSFTQANLPALSAAMQGFFSGGASSPYAAACAGNVAACVASGTIIPSAATYTADLAAYDFFLTYGLSPVSDTTLPPLVPADAYVLIASRYPYLSTDQLNAILYSTELPSGGALDNNTGWARLNLYAASSGYGSFISDVTVTMNAALGGLNAFDIWSNNIPGPGGLTLQGSGTLILAGNDSYTGGTTVLGGTLAVTGTLGGNLTIAPGATFVGNGGYAVASGATLVNAGTFTEVNTPLVNAGIVSNTGMLGGDVNNSGNFANNGVVTGAFTNTGLLSGTGIVGSLALLPSSTVAPGNGIVEVLGALTVAAGATYQAQVGATGAGLIAVGGTASLAGGTIVATSIAGNPALGSSYPILTAAGGVSGSFTSLTEPTSGIAPGTRFDTLYSPSTITLVMTPASYGTLAAAGVAESGSESAVGGALDAIRPAPGVAMGPAQSALFDPLYILPAGSIAIGLDELAPSIYADAMMAGRNAWYLMADAVSAQLAARRGLATDKAASSAPGPNGSTIWFSGLASYDSTGAGGGSPGFSAGLGGAAAGIDVPVAGSGRVGVAVGSVDGQTWSRAGGQAATDTAQFVSYGQWQRGMFFAEAQLGLMYQDENVRRTLPLFGATSQGDTDGIAGGGGVRVGMQKTLGAWLIEPGLGFGGFDLVMNGLAERAGGALAETIGGASLNSAESTLAVSAQRVFVLSETVRMTVKGRLGWSHEFADDTARISASFTGLSGSGFALDSAPIGRDAALVGLGADIKVAAWPVTMFVGYGGAINASSNAQSFDAGVRFIW